MKIKIFIIGYFALLLIGCSSIGEVIYGTNFSISEASCSKFMEKIDTDNEIIDMDVESYKFFLKNKLDSIHIKNFYQPLQVLTFVKGNLFSHSVNCYLTGFPNLEWNFKVEDKCKLSGNTVSLPQIEISDYLFHVNNSSSKAKITEEVVVIVHINCTMGRQSLCLIESIKNLDLQCKVLYINNSSFYLENE